MIPSLPKGKEASLRLRIPLSLWEKRRPLFAEVSPEERKPLFAEVSPKGAVQYGTHTVRHTRGAGREAYQGGIPTYIGRQGGIYHHIHTQGG